MSKKIVIGCGLIRIGRVWGVGNNNIPSEKEVQIFLESAYMQGIRFFDTAPSYGLSEDRLGHFLKNLTNKQRISVSVATKFGEHWDDRKNIPYTNHSYDSLVASLNNSFNKLGSINLLQLHKATKNLLRSSDVAEALAEAKLMGVENIGASISDKETGFAFSSDPRFSYLQLPFNQDNPILLPVIAQAIKNNQQIIFNRPLAMGAITEGKDKLEKKTAIQDAYEFILKTSATGVILTGTASAEHLKENLSAFKKAVSD